MYQRLKNDPKSSDVKKEQDEENKLIKSGAGQNTMPDILKTGNQNAEKVILGKDAVEEEEDEDLFGFFNESPKKKKKAASKDSNTSPQQNIGSKEAADAKEVINVVKDVAEDIKKSGPEAEKNKTEVKPPVDEKKSEAEPVQNINNNLNEEDSFVEDLFGDGKKKAKAKPKGPPRVYGQKDPGKKYFPEILRKATTDYIRTPRVRKNWRSWEMKMI